MQTMAKTVRPNHGERKLLVGRILLQTAAMIWVYKQWEIATLHMFAQILGVFR